MLVTASRDPELYRYLQEKNLERQYDLLHDFIEIGMAHGPVAFDKQMLWALNHVAVAGISQYGGRFREEPIYVGGHIPPHFRDVPELMDRYVSFVHENWDNMSAEGLAAYGLWRLNWIHPFIEGNGRTARAVCYYLLCARHGGLLPGARIVPERIRDDRQPYYDALREIDRNWAEGHLDVAPAPRSSGVPVCQEMSCFVMFGPFRPGLSLRQTGPYTMFFSHSNRLSGARHNAGPAAAAPVSKGAGPGGNRPPKNRFCSYNVPMRMSSAFSRRLRPGSGLGGPLRTGQGRARKERVRYGESPEGAGGEHAAGPGHDARRPDAEAGCRAEAGLGRVAVGYERLADLARKARAKKADFVRKPRPEQPNSIHLLFQPPQFLFRAPADNVGIVVPPLARHRRNDLTGQQTLGCPGDLQIEYRMIHRLGRRFERFKQKTGAFAVDKVGSRAGGKLFEAPEIASARGLAGDAPQEPGMTRRRSRPLGVLPETRRKSRGCRRPSSRRITIEPSGHQSVDCISDGVSRASSASSSRINAAGDSDLRKLFRALV